MGQGFGSVALWVEVGCGSVVGFGPGFVVEDVVVV